MSDVEPVVHKFWGTRSCPRCRKVLVGEDVVSDDWKDVTCQKPCPDDTDGDGNCGQRACPYCGPQRRRFVRVEVLLTESEYRSMRTEASLTASGTVGEAIRAKARLPEEPYGYRGNPIILAETEYRESS